MKSQEIIIVDIAKFVFKTTLEMLDPIRKVRDEFQIELRKNK